MRLCTRMVVFQIQRVPRGLHSRCAHPETLLSVTQRFIPGRGGRRRSIVTFALIGKEVAESLLRMVAANCWTRFRRSTKSVCIPAVCLKRAIAALVYHTALTKSSSMFGHGASWSSGGMGTSTSLELSDFASDNDFPSRKL